jgi:uncharacterized protein YjbJ (UPF0337 family)
MRLTQFHLLVGSLLLAGSPVTAQTTTPSSAPAASTGGGTGWLWLILLLAVAGGAVWYFWFRDKPSTTGSAGVDSDRVAGSAKQAKGAAKEGVGSLIGDAKLQAEGKLDKAEGKVQNTAGGIKDTLKGQ